jgi:hypothetical protein
MLNNLKYRRKDLNLHTLYGYWVLSLVMRLLASHCLTITYDAKSSRCLGL